MSFGLKNDEATYQRMVNKIFEKQIKRNMEIYVDDKIVNTKSKEEHARYLQEVFKVLRNFLGFMISE